MPWGSYIEVFVQIEKNHDDIGIKDNQSCVYFFKKIKKY
jgi:hypothetical protein